MWVGKRASKNEKQNGLRYAHVSLLFTYSIFLLFIIQSLLHTPHHLLSVYINLLSSLFTYHPLFLTHTPIHPSTHFSFTHLPICSPSELPYGHRPPTGSSARDKGGTDEQRIPNRHCSLMAFIAHFYFSQFFLSNVLFFLKFSSFIKNVFMTSSKVKCFGGLW